MESYRFIDFLCVFYLFYFLYLNSGIDGFEEKTAGENEF